MQMVYGNLSFPAAGVGCRIFKNYRLNAAQIPFEVDVNFLVEGWWTGTQSALISDCAIMEAALNVPYQDLVLLADDGTVAARLLNAGAVNGVVIHNLEYPRSGYHDAEFTTYRTFTFRAQATYPVGPENQIVDYQESLTNSGGGPLNGFMQPVNAPPIPLTLFQNTPYFANQAGHFVIAATNPVAYGVPPSPIFPAALLRAPQVRNTNTRVGLNRWHLRTEWSYDMGSPTNNLLGTPNFWR